MHELYAVVVSKKNGQGREPTDLLVEGIARGPPARHVGKRTNTTATVVSRFSRDGPVAVVVPRRPAYGQGRRFDQVGKAQASAVP